MTISKRWFVFLGIVILLALIAIIVAVASLININDLIYQNLKQPISITLIAVASVIGSVLLLLTALIVALLFINKRVFDKSQAFGLPEGSIRAVIALSLIIIFAESSLFLYADISKNDRSETLNGLTKEMLANIPVNDLISLDFKDNSYSAVRRMPSNLASTDFANQLLTTLSTLVVSLIGFYFGSRSSESKRSDASRTKPLINKFTPNEAVIGQTLTLQMTGKDLLLINEVALEQSQNKLTLSGVVESSDSSITAKFEIPNDPSYVGEWNIIARTFDDKVASSGKKLRIKPVT